MGQRVLDLDVSATLIAERFVGEILGWDLVDWSAVEPYKGRKFFFGRRRGEASIHDQLKPLFDRCDPQQNDFSALKPSPIVNANLSKLVGCLCRHVGKHELPGAEKGDRVLERTIEQDRLHQAVVRRILNKIETDPRLGERAERLKRIAAAAEGQLEKHFADLINQRLESSFLQNGNLDPYRIRGLRDQAKSRVEETSALNKRELVDLAVPNLALDDEALIKIEMTKILLSRFPYVRNYELMLLAEIAMLQTPLTPRFARERMLSARGGGVDTALMERLDRATAEIASQIGPALRSEEWLCSGGQNRTIAMCGSGSLPMTALFLHLFTGADIVLVDDDQAAVERSRRLIANLERLEVLEPGVLTIVQQNAGHLHFHAPGMAGEVPSKISLGCDAVMIASLVDREAKSSIAAQLGSDASAPGLLIMRSATGLSAKFAYDAVPTETFSHSRLAYCGETLPATQIATHLDRAEAARQGVACAESPDVLAIAHPDVVNTTEIYRRIPASRKSVHPDFSACGTVHDWLRALERAGEKPA